VVIELLLRLKLMTLRSDYMSADITFCSRKCGNMECKRNLKNYPKEGTVYCSMANFVDCKEYKEAEE